ncbi:MAG: PAS domain S-box protein [Gammaproteobacteria bacterium]|nr:PAS domain S-box protein [Gammaproteobacteria bacterium]
MMEPTSTIQQRQLQTNHYQLEQLFRAIGTTMVASLLASLFLYASIHAYFGNAHVHLWMIAQGIVTIIALSYRSLFRNKNQQFTENQWCASHMAITATSSVLWCLAISWTYTNAAEVRELIIFLIAGLQAVAATTLSYKPWPVIVFSTPISIAIMIQLYLHPNSIDALAIAYFAALLPITTFIAIRNYNNNVLLYRHLQKSKIDSELLLRSKERFRNIIDSAGDMLLVHAPDGRIIDANHRAVNLLGYPSKTELLKKTITDIAGDASDIYHRLLWLLSDNEPVTYESQYTCLDNKILTVDACVTHYDDPREGDVVLVLARDITVKKQERQELNESRQKLDLHIQSTPLATIEWDSEQKISSWNPAAEHIFGYTSDEVVGTCGIKILLDESKNTPHLFSELISENNKQVIISHITKDKRVIYCEWFVTRLSDNQGNPLGASAFAMDITTRIQAEQAFKMAVQREQQANNAKSEFLSRMSHELRTPLNAVIGLSQLLQFDDNLTNQQQEYIGDISNAGQHLLGLINEVLDISRIEQNRFLLNEQPEKLHQLIRSAINLTENVIKNKKLELIYQPQVDDFYFLVDKQRVVQVLVNLLSNATKFNNEGGKIWVSERLLNDDTVEISVRDNGMGIPNEMQNKIFQPFQRAGAEYSGIEGNGLGLMLSKQLIEKMSGRIGFESTLGKGSCFWIRLPTKSSSLLNRHAQSSQQKPIS